MRDRLRHVNVWAGLVVAIPLGVYGVYSLATATSVLVGDDWGSGFGMLHLRGASATAMGLVYLGVAIALHSHFVWGRIARTWQLGVLGLVLGLAGALCAFAYVVWQFLTGSSEVLVA